MPEQTDIEICTRVVRAVLAIEIANREAVEFADSALPKRKDLTGIPHLSLVRYNALGYPMGDNQLVLTQLRDGHEVRSDVGITYLDEILDDTKADLHDRLWNLSPKFALEVSLEEDENPTLNANYEDILRSAQFAGNVEAQSESVRQTLNFLFPKDDDGLPNKSSAYLRYEQFEEEIDALQQCIGAASAAADHPTVRSLENKLARKNAEWKTLGQKSRIEDAIRILNAADADAGFEDERNRFIEIIERRKILRLNSADAYALVDVRPLEPLINPAEDQNWDKVEIDGMEIPSMFDTAKRALFDLSYADIKLASERIVTINADVTSVMLMREWFRLDFLTARYWRHRDRVLSDGMGGGELPTLARKAVFMKWARFQMDDGLRAAKGNAPKATPIKTIRLGKTVNAPILKMLTSQQPKAKGKLSDLAKNKLTASQLANLMPIMMAKQIMVQPPAKLTSRSKRNLAPLLKRSAIAKTLVKPHGKTVARIASLKPAGRTILAKRGIGLAQPQIQKAPIRRAARRESARPARRARVFKLAVRGRIQVGTDVTPENFVLSYSQFDRNDQLVGETAIEIRKDTSTQYRFELNISQLSKLSGNTIKLKHITLKLRDVSGNVLIEQNFPFARESPEQFVQWNVARTVNLFEIIEAGDLTLFGYVLELLPKSPNPDETLNWDASI